MDYTLEEIDKAASFVLEHSKHNIFLVYGEMGAGKTTVIRAISMALGAKNLAVSPTFAIVNEYAASEHTIYHFDLYRLKDLRELSDIGFEDYLSAEKAYLFIEWPLLALPMLTEAYHEIRLTVCTHQTRHLTIF